ncbi:hypothetical protein [Niabella beijingensis]|uniref:hypothetical protein n=1 Tax=Niabella beijingensis TaxID=2872700 RepID=UPI001CBEF2EE|nr:hypothetical protein [Niabella beijingensis]MBZ4192494.1 hypothetical protein [Niabella beijingensis]
MKQPNETGTAAMGYAADKTAVTVAPRAWKRFLVRNVLIYAGTNVFFNSVIPYLSFEDPGAVYLFKGTYCVARFLLPLAFFIPLLVTIDTMNKMRILFQKHAAGFSFPPGFRYNSFLLKHALINGCITLVLTLAVMVVLQLGMPEGQTYNGLTVSILMGIYAGTVALYFMKRSINRFAKIRQVVLV